MGIFLEPPRSASHGSRVDAYVQDTIEKQRYLVTTNYVITELVVLLSSRYHLPRQEVIRAINTLRKDTSIEIIHVDEVLHDESWRLIEVRLDKEWSQVDASSFVVMKRYGMTQALTSDHHFAQAGFTCIPGHTTRGSRS